jgi:hypothetical protein
MQPTIREEKLSLEIGLIHHNNTEITVDGTRKLDDIRILFRM